MKQCTMACCTGRAHWRMICRTDCSQGAPLSMRSCLHGWNSMRLLPALHVLGWRCSHVTPLRPIVRVLLGCSLAERLRRPDWNGGWPHLPAEHSFSDVKLRGSNSQP